jgi:hypothetical protein
MGSADPEDFMLLTYFKGIQSISYNFPLAVNQKYTAAPGAAWG